MARRRVFGTDGGGNVLMREALCLDVFFLPGAGEGRNFLYDACAAVSLGAVGGQSASGIFFFFFNRSNRIIAIR